MTFPVLHIHAQSAWHDAATIVGNREALTLLRDAIGAALDNAEASTEAFVADGEGYEVRVMLRDGGMDANAWANARLPYIEEMASGNGEGPI